MALDAVAEERAQQKEVKNANEVAKGKVVPLPVPVPRRQPVWSSPYLKIAAGLIIAVGLAIALWLIFQKSDVEKGMIALNQAQGNERLIQSRVSGLNYAEKRTLRGNEAAALHDRQARDYSELLFQQAAREKQDAAAYHALGRLYLAERNFDKAREQFEKALAKDPNDPQLQSDIGAMFLELGQSTGDSQYFAQSLQYLDRALELNPSSPEALFNRALVYQQLHQPQAKEAWRRYLQVDSTSAWAKEADRNLKELEAPE